jgi:hypothetical protein
VRVEQTLGNRGTSKATHSRLTLTATLSSMLSAVWTYITPFAVQIDDEVFFLAFHPFIPSSSNGILHSISNHVSSKKVKKTQCRLKLLLLARRWPVVLRSIERSN